MMIRQYRSWLPIAIIGLAPFSLQADEKVIAASIRVGTIHAAQPVPSATIAAPFGYFATHWRAFPVSSPTLSMPAESPSTPPPREAEKQELRPAAASAAPTRQATREMPSGVPVPHPATVIHASHTTRQNDRGFATLRVQRIAVPAARSAPVPAKPSTPRAPATRQSTAIKDTPRTAKSNDGVIRPEWPVLPPLPK